MTRAQRWRKATRAVFIGWLSAFVVTSPVQIFEVLRNSGQSFTLMLSALGYGFAVWLLITLAGVSFVWICIATPAALLISPQSLLKRPLPVVVLCVVAPVLPIAYRLHVWTHLYHDGIGWMSFWIYALFAAVFSGVAIRSYLRLLAREP
ncbi:MAG TPA: hypothetical protein VHT24_15365 [Pseudacidobacterium sp.]|jgi:hypothetical protein|nr:hypothetical protein [Pseudacidobacterium sp.]